MADEVLAKYQEVLVLLRYKEVETVKFKRENILSYESLFNSLRIPFVNELIISLKK